jgi:hypothetical protein
MWKSCSLFVPRPPLGCPHIESCCLPPDVCCGAPHADGASTRTGSLMRGALDAVAAAPPEELV